MTGWTWETEPECFKDVDTKWHMDDKLTWLSPDGDPTKTFLEKLEDMISESFHAHDTGLRHARRYAGFKGHSHAYALQKKSHKSTEDGGRRFGQKYCSGVLNHLKKTQKA